MMDSCSGYLRSNRYALFFSRIELPHHIPGALPQTPRFLRHRGSSKISVNIKKGSPKTPPPMTIFRRRLSGYPSASCSSAELASVSPDLFFHDRHGMFFISSGSGLSWCACIKIQEEFLIKLSLFFFRPHCQEFGCHSIEQA